MILYLKFFDFFFKKKEFIVNWVWRFWIEKYVFRQKKLWFLEIIKI